MDVIVNLVPCEQKFLSYLAFSVCGVVRVTRRKQTNYVTDKPRERLRKR